MTINHLLLLHEQTLLQSKAFTDTQRQTPALFCYITGEDF